MLATEEKPSTARRSSFRIALFITALHNGTARIFLYNTIFTAERYYIEREK
jgi:hypothetical protein